MMKHSRYIMMAVLLLAASSLAAWAFAGSYLFRKEVPTPPENASIAVKGDPLLLKELASVYAKMTGEEWAMEGEVKMIDRARPENNMAPAAFVFHQQGKLLYYRIDQMEIVNLSDCYIVIQHDVKKMLVSPPKEVNQAPYLPLEALTRMVETEEYGVTKKISGAVATISLVRENHISCKEYSVSYDTASMHLRSIRTRLTNLDAPADTAMDKVTEVNISSWPPVAGKSYFNKHRYVQAKGNQLVPATAYKEYQLIRL